MQSCEHGKSETLCQECIKRHLGIRDTDGTEKRHAVVPSALTDGLAALQKLATTWAAEGNFLDGEDDHREDKIRGKIYKECANELKALIGG